MNFISTCIFGVVLTLTLTMGCSNSPNDTQSTEAQVTLINWTQQRIVVQRDTLYQDVEISYKIENTGMANITHYEVYFRAETVNNKVYEGAGSGDDLKISEIDINTANIETNLNKAKLVEITGQFLE